MANRHQIEAATREAVLQIATALDRLERDTGCNVTGLFLRRDCVQRIDDDKMQYLATPQIELSAPAENIWIGSPK